MRTALKRLLLAVLIALVVVQIPFVYRRIKFGQLAEKVRELKQANTPNSQADDSLTEHRGVIHVHTHLGGHSTGTFAELIEAADANELDFVIMTEHWSDRIDTAKLTLNGRYGKTLFVGGNEIDTATEQDRLLIVPGQADDGSRVLGTPDLTRTLKDENRASFVTYPEKFSSWNSAFDGIEVFSLHTNSQEVNRLIAFMDTLWSHGTYPEHVLMSYFARPHVHLQKFDEVAARRKVSLVGGSDAHSNIGFHLIGDDAGNKLLNYKLDNYTSIFRLVRQHVLLRPGQDLSQENLLSALKEGRSFIGLDGVADTSGFRFGTADSAVIMGDAIDLQLAGRSGLLARSPVPGKFIVYRNGEIFTESTGTDRIAFNPVEPGAYRVEVFLDQLGPPYDEMPWIISNPIFVQTADRSGSPAND